MPPSPRPDSLLARARKALAPARANSPLSSLHSITPAAVCHRPAAPFSPSDTPPASASAAALSSRSSLLVLPATRPSDPDPAAPPPPASRSSLLLPASQRYRTSTDRNSVARAPALCLRH